MKMAINQSSLSTILMDSMVALEKHLGSVEEKISVIFNSINSIMEYSSNSGGTILAISRDIKELKENLIYKEDLISQLSTIHSEISSIIRVLESNNKEISDALSIINEKIERIDKELEGIKNPESAKTKGIFRK